MSHISRRSTAMVAQAPLLLAITALGGTVVEGSTLRYYANQTAKADIVVRHPAFPAKYDMGFTQNKTTRTFEAVGDFSMMGAGAARFMDQLVQEYGVQESILAAKHAGYEIDSIETLPSGEKRVRLTVTV